MDTYSWTGRTGRACVEQAKMSVDDDEGEMLVDAYVAQLCDIADGMVGRGFGRVCGVKLMNVRSCTLPVHMDVHE